MPSITILGPLGSIRFANTQSDTLAVQLRLHPERQDFHREASITVSVVGIPPVCVIETTKQKAHVIRDFLNKYIFASDQAMMLDLVAPDSPKATPI